MEAILFVGLFLVVGAINIAGLAFMIWALVDAIKNPSLDDTQRIIWVVVILTLNCVGAIAYLIAGRDTAPPSTHTGSGTP
jgi:hypothetical protein